MRIIIIYDLPAVTNAEKRNHHLFRKFLKNNGFVMLQESFYSKLVLNPTAAETMNERIRRNLPPDGLVQSMVMTEKQYASMVDMLGDSGANTDVVNSFSSLVVF